MLDWTVRFPSVRVVLLALMMVLVAIRSPFNYSTSVSRTPLCVAPPSLLERAFSTQHERVYACICVAIGIVRHESELHALPYLPSRLKV